MAAESNVSRWNTQRVEVASVEAAVIPRVNPEVTLVQLSSCRVPDVRAMHRVMGNHPAACEDSPPTRPAKVGREQAPGNRAADEEESRHNSSLDCRGSGGGRLPLDYSTGNRPL